ncbi:MAG: hypothetical protein V3T02_05100, partial [Alphaproteobacteria bacterium]
MTVTAKRFIAILTLGALLTASWLGAAAYYVETYIDWNNLLFLLPHELGAFVAGVFTPLVFLWLALWLIVRGNRQSIESRAIEAQLKNFIY